MLKLNEFRQLYPMYGDMTDYEITARLHATQYADMPFEQFAQGFGGPLQEDTAAIAARDYNAVNHGASISAQDIRNKDRSGFFGGLRLLAEGVYDAVTDQFPEDMARAWRGGDIDPAKPGFADSVIKQQVRDNATRIPSLQEAEGDTLANSLYQGPRSIATSVATGLAGSAAGGAAGSVVGPVGTAVGGMVGGATMSGAAFYRIAKDQFVDEAQQAMQRSMGRTMTSEEAAELNQAIDADATHYGLWEAGPEAISQFFTLGMIKGAGGAVLKKIGLGGMADAVGKRALTRIPAKMAAEVGEEEVTEGITFMGQEGIRQQYGLRPDVPTVGEFIKEQAGPVAVGSLLQLGGMKAAHSIGNRIWTRPDGKAGATAGLRSLVEGKSEVDAMQAEKPGTEMVPVGPAYTVHDAEIVPEPADFVVTPGGRVAGRGAMWPQEAPIAADAGQAFLPEGSLALPAPNPALPEGTGAIPMPSDRGAGAPIISMGTMPGGAPITVPLPLALPQGSEQTLPLPTDNAHVDGGAQNFMAESLPNMSRFPEPVDFPMQSAPRIVSVNARSFAVEGLGKLDRDTSRLLAELDGRTETTPAGLRWRFPREREDDVRGLLADLSENGQSDAAHEPASRDKVDERAPRLAPDPLHVTPRESRADLLQQLPPESRKEARRLTNAQLREKVRAEQQVELEKLVREITVNSPSEAESGVVKSVTDFEEKESVDVATRRGRFAGTGGEVRHDAVQEPGGEGRDAGAIPAGLGRQEGRPSEASGDIEPTRRAGDAGDLHEVSARSGRQEKNGARATSVKIPNRDAEPVTYEIVEADEVQASHLPEYSFEKNPRYGLENERRYHDEPASQRKVLENAARLDSDFLLKDSVDANNGAPVVDQDGNVLGGNGRAMSTRQAYQSGGEAAEAYRAALRERAEELGMNPANVDAMRRPMLIRRLDKARSREERQALVTAMNDSFTDSKNARASGKTRGDRLSRRSMEMLSEGLKDAETLRQYFDEPKSADTVERLIRDGVIQSAERNAYVSGDGLLNPDGKRVVEEALRGRIARNYDALASLPADMVAKIDTIIPSVLIAEQVGSTWDITGHLRDAVDLLAEYKGSGAKEPGVFLKQVNMVTGKTPKESAGPEAQDIFRQALSLKKGDFVKAFASYASQAKISPEAGAMPGMAKSQPEAFKAAFGGEKEADTVKAAEKSGDKQKKNDVLPNAAKPQRQAEQKKTVPPKKQEPASASEADQRKQKSESVPVVEKKLEVSAPAKRETIDKPIPASGAPLASLRKENHRRADDTPVTVVEVDPEGVPDFGRAENPIKALKEWILAELADKTVTIKETGRHVTFTAQGIRDSLKRSRNETQRKTYGGLIDLIENAAYDGFEQADARHERTVEGQEMYFAAMRLGGSLYSVRLKLDQPRSKAGLTYKDHKVTSVDISKVQKETSPMQDAGLAPKKEASGLLALDDVRAINLSILKGAVNPSHLEKGVLSSLAPGEFLPVARRGLRPIKAEAARRVAGELDRLVARAAKTEVVQNFQELPARLKAAYSDKAAALEGVYDPATGKVWLVAGNLFSLERAADVWAHEQFVHHGLRGMLSEGERKRLLNRLWLSLGGMGNAGIREVAERYGVAPQTEGDSRLQVMEEYLANMAEKKRAALLSSAENTLWQRVVAAIREVWSKLVQAVGGRNTAMSTTDVDRLLSALGRYVMDGVPQGRQAKNVAGTPAFASVGENREVTGREAWDQLQADTEEWGRQLDEFVSRTNMRELLTVCHTPDVLRKLGAPNLPLSMTGDNLGKVMSDKPDHNLPVDLLKLLPAALTEPVMVFESATSPDSFVMLTELKHEGRSVMAAVHLDTVRQRIRVNDIASAYRRSNEAWYLKQIEDGRLLYQDKTKSLAWARTARLQLPLVRKLPARLSGKKILTEKDVVKPVRPEGFLAAMSESQKITGNTGWDQLQADTEEWGRQLDEFAAGPGDKTSLLSVCRTPDVLRKLGAPDLPMSMTRDNLAKVMSDKPDHNLPVDLLKLLPAALTEPVMVFESATSPDSFVMLTELKHEGRSVMAAVHLDTVRQRIRVNDIASAYRRSNEAWYLKQIEDGRLLYQDKTKSLAWARTNRLQLPKVRKLPARLSGKKILTEKDVVKPVRPEGFLAAMSESQKITGNTGWDQLQADTEEWGRQLDEFAAGSGGSPRDRFHVGYTPDVLIQLGAKALPMEMTRGNLRKVIDKHGVPLDVLRELPVQLADPLLVLKSATMADAYVVLTEMKRAGENLVAAIHFDVEAGRMRINDIASIHDRSTVRDTREKVPGWVWIKKQIAAGNLRYYDKTRSSRWFRELSGLQLSGVMNRESYRGIKILTEKDVVKPVRPEGKPLASLATADRTAEKSEQRAKKRPLSGISAKELEDMPGLVEALSKIGVAKPTLAEKWANVKDSWKVTLEQGLFDRFASIKEYSEAGYKMARMSTGLGSQLQAIMEFGAPVWREKAMAVEGKGLREIFEPVAGELDRFLHWMVGRRAARLKEEGRENLLTKTDINALLALAEGKTKEGKKRTAEYGKVFDDLAVFKGKVLDFAQEAGVIDPVGRKVWDNADYIPFYRVQERLDGVSMRGPHNSKGLTNQNAGIKELKGGLENLGDPLENMLRNFAHLIDASSKNRAALQVFTDMYTAGMAEQLTTDRTKARLQEDSAALSEAMEAENLLTGLTDEQKQSLLSVFAIRRDVDSSRSKNGGVVYARREGRPYLFKVTDPLAYRALTGLNDKGDNGGVMRFGRKIKRILTTGVTIMPDFMVRNFLRDSVHSWTVEHKSGIKPLASSLKGLKATLSMDDDTRQLFAAGATFMGAGYRLGNDPEAARLVLGRLLSKSRMNKDGFFKSVLDNPKKMASALSLVWDKYESLGGAAENAVRHEIYSSMRKKGYSHLDASFAARDIMDFSMRGEFAFIRTLTDLVPFMGARLTGLHRLGQGALENPRAFAVKGGVVALAAVGLFLMNLMLHRKEWEELEDWDKDSYFHFWVGEEHFRLPKPFEVGFLFGTIPERMAEQVMTDAPVSVFWGRVARGIADQLSMDPTPQAVKPILEDIANRDSFRGSPIVGQALAGRMPTEQHTVHTTMTARMTADAMDAVLAPVFGKSSDTGVDALRSPVRLEHLVNGYFGGLGSTVLGLSDRVIRWVRNDPVLPAGRGLEDWPLMGAFYRGNADSPKRTRFEGELYDALREADALYSSLKMLRDSGEHEAEQRLRDQMGDKGERMLRDRKALNRLRRDFSTLNRMMDAVYRDRTMSASQKRTKLDELQAKKNETAKREWERHKEVMGR